MLFDETSIRSALARVCNSNGATLGTAFFILPHEGIALTCHHLVENSQDVLLQSGDGKFFQGTVADDDRFPEIDVAIIRCPSNLTASALPIVTEFEGISRFWTKGFHFYGTEITDALPAAGAVDGVTAIQFSTSDRTYQLSNVLVLKHDVIDAGLSGAPVIDPETGVVFALVNAKFVRQGPLAGFALPLAQVKEHSAKLKELFEANANCLPRYGRFLNYLGAREICRKQRDTILGRLIRRDFYLRDLYTPRAEQQTVEDFYKSDALILPIIGNAGVGKTMMLAEFARLADDREALLLLGRDVRVDESDLSRVITARLRENSAPLLGVKGDASLLVEALRTKARQLTVFFDGFNEIPVSAAGAMPAWVEQTVNWLEHTNTRLIISSRPEFWQVSESLFDKKLMYSVEANREQKKLTSGLLLSDFNQEEAEEVRKRYGLSLSISVRQLQHPLMARIYWEMQNEGQGKLEQITRYRVMQRFIKKKCDRIALAVGPSVISSHVEVHLREAARMVFEKGGFELEDKEFFDLFTGNAALADQFVQEGLFMSTSAGKRFVFDEIAEFVQSKSLPLETIVSQFAADPLTRPNLTAGPIVYTILRLEDEGRAEDVRKALETLLASRLRQNKGSAVSENVIVQLLSQLHEPERFRTDIETLADAIVGGSSQRHDRFGFRAALLRSELPIGFKLDLLRLFLLKEDSYDFEHHHWGDLERYVIRDKDHTGAFLSELIQSAPEQVFPILAAWLPDESNLRDGRSTLGHAAMALMFYHRHINFDLFCESLATVDRSRTDVIFVDVVKQDFHEIIDVLLGWSTRDDRSLLATAGRVAMRAARDSEDEVDQDRLYQLLSSVTGRVDEEIDVFATIGIGRLHKYRDLVIDDLISLFKKGHPLVDGYILGELADTHFQKVVSAVKEVMESSSDRVSTTFTALINQRRTTQERDTLIDLLNLGASNGLSRFYSFRLAMEYLLGLAATESDVSKMYDMVKHITTCDPAILSNVRYFAAASPDENVHRKKLRAQLLEFVISSETDPGNQRRLIGLIAASKPIRADALEIILALREKMPVDRLQEALISSAAMHELFANALAKWLKSDVRFPPSGLTQSFISKLDEGLQFPEAANAALDELLGY